PVPAPATPPTPNRPDEKPADKEGDKDFPSPAELMRKLKADRDRKAKQAQVVLFDLTDPIGERSAEFSLFGDYRLNLRSLTERLEKVRTDKNVKAVLVTVGDPGLSLAQAQEVRDAMAAVVKAGKPVFVHADAYDTTLYTLASGASDVCLLEGGELMMPGIGVEQMFLKGLFDKVGLKADYVQIGEYKGADEQYTRTGATEELKGEMRRLIDGLYAEIVAGIAAHRKIDPDVVRQTIDESMVSGKIAKARKLVDHLTDQDGLRELIAKRLGGGEIALDPFYGVQRPDPVDFSNPFGLLASLTKKSAAEQPADKPAVAVIYAEGVIVDGESDDGIFSDGGNVGSENMRKAFRTALRDDNVKAVVIRIDSPGGSALASEVMWQAARRLAAKKPVIISIGGMAASGGYYLASAGETIYADPTAIVGSIGVVGGKFVMQGLFDWAGVKTETFSKGRNADLFSSNQPFTDRQRVLVTTWMKSTYDQFTQRVMTTRKDKIQDIDRVARGRIFVARQAKDLGMVDEIGGIQAAIATAAKRGGLKPNEFEVKQVPAPKTLGDYLSGNGGDGPQASAAALPVKPNVTVKLDALLGTL
ncbi:MAG TPA: signal peptide peptidase SppA, partial [Thermomicrobiales bacterium]|nr:signal peptide peptidase SppA [Thermomicrobiales bacterium]